MGLLDCSPEVAVLFIASVALPQVDNVSRLAIKLFTLLVLTNGHWRQLVAPHFWVSSSFSSKDNILLRTTAFPMDGFFLTAMVIFVSPISVRKSVAESFRIFLKVLIWSKKNNGKVSVLFSS